MEYRYSIRMSNDKNVECRILIGSDGKIEAFGIRALSN
jgi:hypothetical protein